MVSAATFLVFSGYYFLVPVLPLYIASWGCNEAVVDLVIVVTSLAIILLKFSSGVLADFKNRRLLMLTGAALAGLVILLYAGSKWILLLVLARLCHGVGLGFFSKNRRDMPEG